MEKTPSRYTAPLQVILMFVIIIATILLGFFMMPGSQEEKDKLLTELGTTNHGTFLKPMKEIDELGLTDEAGEPWVWQGPKAKWRIMVVPGRQCGDTCRGLLYLTRQMHVRLGKNSHRVERVYVATEEAFPEDLAVEIEKEHPYLKVLHAGRDNLTGWLRDTNSGWSDEKPEVIVVDPKGMAMMFYDEKNNGIDMLEDINHLLKYSHE